MENKASRYRRDRGCRRCQYYRRCFSYSISTIWRPLYQTASKSQCLQMTCPCSALIFASWSRKLPWKKPSHASWSGAVLTRWRSTLKTVSFFTSNLHKTRWQPTIHLEGQPLRFNPLPKPTHFFFHSFIATMSYSLQTSFNSVMKDRADKSMYGVPPQGHLQGQPRDNSNTGFFTLKKEHIYMCSYIISFVYIWRIISCLKGLLCFIIFHKHMECICHWQFIKNKKQEKWSMPITKTKHV